MQIRTLWVLGGEEEVTGSISVGLGPLLQFRSRMEYKN